MDVSIDGHDLSELAAAPPPILTAYLDLGAPDDMAGRLEAAAEGLETRHRPPAPAIGRAAEAVERRISNEPDLLETASALVVVTADDGRSWTFSLADPIRTDVVRWGQVPSLGGLLESTQLVPSHVVVTPADDDRFDLISFGARGKLDTGDGALQLGLDTVGLTEALRFVEPSLVLAGDLSDDLLSELQSAVPNARVQFLDQDLEGDALADHVVRVAASYHAEMLGLELGRFRAARAVEAAVEGDAVLDAVVEGRVSELLVHDDPADQRLAGGDRLVDRVVAAALEHGVVPTMIPAVVVETGPAGGLGGILAREASGDRAIVSGGVA